MKKRLYERERRSLSSIENKTLANSVVVGSLLIAGATIIAYVPALKAQYVWDDTALTANPLMHITGGLWYLWAHPSANTTEEHFWPIVYSTFWIENRIWGLAPLGYHLINILFHAVNSILLWRLLRHLANPGAWLAGALFALHPLHVESVAWVIERKDLLSTFFYLLAFRTYIRFVEDNARTKYFLVLLLYAASLLSKSVAVTLPFALLLWLYWKNRITPRQIALIVPLVGVGICLTLLDLHFVHLRVIPPSGLSVFQRGLLASREVAFYILKLLWPINLVTNYPRWTIRISLFDFLFPMALCTILAATCFCKRWGYSVRSAFLFFLVTLLPMMGFIDFGFMRLSFVADRFQYLAGAGLIALAAAALHHLSNALIGSRLVPKYATMVTLLMPLGLLTWRQAALYKNDETLFTYNIAKNPAAAMPYDNLAVALSKRGAMGQVRANLEKAVTLDPTFPNAVLNMGSYLNLEDSREEAAVYFGKVVELSDASALERAVAWSGLGSIAERNRDIDSASQYYTRSLDSDPYHGDALAHLGYILLAQGELSRANDLFCRLVDANPDSPDGWNGLGSIQLQMGHWDQAEKDLKRSLDLAPRYVDALNNFGILDRNRGRVDDAVMMFNKVLTIDPNNIRALNNLGAMLARQGKDAEAEVCLSRVLELAPNLGESLYNLGVMKARQRNFDQAIQLFDRATTIDPMNVQAITQRASARLELNEVAAAVEDLTQALSLDPNNTDLKTMLAKAREKLGTSQP